MRERGVAEHEVAEALALGRPSAAVRGRVARVRVFREGYRWRGTDYPNKEVRVLYAVEGNDTVVITVRARYGQWGGGAMKVTYDAQVDAAYIYLTKKVSEPETRQVDDDIALDFDEQGRLVGIEVLAASKRLDLTYVASTAPQRPRRKTPKGPHDGLHQHQG